MISDLTTTIVTKNPEYKNKKFLLADKDRQGLFKSEGNRIRIEIDEQGNIHVAELQEDFRVNRLDTSLERMVAKYLDIDNPSATQILQYLVLPEMEVERIFNSLRYKYLKAIHLSNFDKPDEKINAGCNKAFQSLAGIKVYQGNVNAKQRKDNDEFWREKYFKPRAKSDLKWEEEKEALKFIISFIRKQDKNFSQTYAELIAIKPGFHEIWVHLDYFTKVLSQGELTNSRHQVFRMLRGTGDFSDLSLEKIPSEINSKDYRSYAACNVTEGPFVFRKHIDVSYYDEIRKIKTEDDRSQLHKNFHILDYQKPKPASNEELEKLLIDAERFKGFCST